MKRLVVLVAAGLAAVAVTAVLSSSGSAQSSGRTLQVFEPDKGSTFGLVDNPPRAKNKRNPAISAGDYIVIGNPVLDQARKKRLGRFDAQCTAIARGKNFSRPPFLCHAAMRLRDGTIAFTADFKGLPRTVVAAVTGGTGAYNGARGTLTSKTVKTGTVVTISLLP